MSEEKRKSIKKEGYDVSRLLITSNVKQSKTPSKVPGQSSLGASSSTSRLGSIRPKLKTPKQSFTPNVPVTAGFSAGPRNKFQPNVASSGNVQSSGRGRMKQQPEDSSQDKPGAKGRYQKRNFKPNASGARGRSRLVSIAEISGGLAPAGSGGLMDSNLLDSSILLDEKEEDKKARLLKENKNLVESEKDLFRDVKDPPVLLPFDANEEQIKEDIKKGQKRIEHDSERQSIFKQEGSQSIGKDELFFIQFPSSLPIQDKNKTNQTKKKASASVDDEDNIWTVPFENTLTKLPTGCIGEIVVYKSGKTKMKLGEVDYDVVSGANCSFLENLFAISSETKHSFLLGDIKKRILCVPDVESILSKENLK